MARTPATPWVENGKMDEHERLTQDGGLGEELRNANRLREEARSRAVFESRDQNALATTAAPGARAAAHRYLSRERTTRMRQLLERHLPSVARPRILDVGCGGGHDLADWMAAGWDPADLAGVDLVPG